MKFGWNTYCECSSYSSSFILPSGLDDLIFWRSKLYSSAISNYYNKSETDAIFNQDKHRLKCAVLEFEDVNNLSLDTLSIIGSTNIAITDSSSNNLINMSATSINITPPLQCFSNVNITGTLTASNMYNKSQVDGLIANVASLQNNEVIF